MASSSNQTPARDGDSPSVNPSSFARSPTKVDFPSLMGNRLTSSNVGLRPNPTLSETGSTLSNAPAMASSSNQNEVQTPSAPANASTVPKVFRMSELATKPIVFSNTRTINKSYNGVHYLRLEGSYTITPAVAKRNNLRLLFAPKGKFEPSLTFDATPELTAILDQFAIMVKAEVTPAKYAFVKPDYECKSGIINDINHLRFYFSKTGSIDVITRSQGTVHTYAKKLNDFMDRGALLSIVFNVVIRYNEKLNALRISTEVLAIKVVEVSSSPLANALLSFDEYLGESE